VTLQRQFLIWAVSLAVLVFFLWLFSPILLPFIAGLVLAYFLDPVADALERYGLPRLAATLVILLVAILAVVLALIIVAPMLADQVAKFAGDLPNLIRTLVQRFDEFAPAWVKELLARSGSDVQGTVSNFAGKAAEWMGTVLSTLLTGGMALVNLVSLLVVTPIVAFYLLLDWDHIVAKVDNWVPREHVGTVRSLANEINVAMAGFIRGQGTVCLLLGILYATALSLAGLKFGLAIGLVAGFLTFIPYAGALIGGVLAIGVALVQFWPDYWSILMIVGIFAIGQFIEGNFLSPNLVGKSVGLHPVWLMFALFAFGYAFGFVGLLLAVPLAAAAGVLVRFAIGQYLGSKLYLGTNRSMPVPVSLDATDAAPRPAQKSAAKRRRT
jgi:predicted PurR-regulated permease PerM